MPRSRSIFIQSDLVLRRSPLALTWPARLMAPPNSSSFSVKVVLPASGCEMMAKVRRRATSVDSGERSDEADSAVRAGSDMSEPVAGKPGAIKRDLQPPVQADRRGSGGKAAYRERQQGLQPRGTIGSRLDRLS